MLDWGVLFWGLLCCLTLLMNQGVGQYSGFQMAISSNCNRGLSRRRKSMQVLLSHGCKSRSGRLHAIYFGFRPFFVETTVGSKLTYIFQPSRLDMSLLAQKLIQGYMRRANNWGCSPSVSVHSCGTEQIFLTKQHVVRWRSFRGGLCQHRQADGNCRRNNLLVNCCPGAAILRTCQLVQI